MQVGILYKIINFFLDGRPIFDIIVMISFGISHRNGPPVSGPVSAEMSILSSDFFVFGKISHSDGGEQVQKLAFCDLTCFGPHGIIFSYFVQPLMTDGSVEHHTE